MVIRRLKGMLNSVTIFIIRTQLPLLPSSKVTTSRPTFNKSRSRVLSNTSRLRNHKHLEVRFNQWMQQLWLGKRHPKHNPSLEKLATAGTQSASNCTVSALLQASTASLATATVTRVKTTLRTKSWDNKPYNRHLRRHRVHSGQRSTQQPVVLRRQPLRFRDTMP